MAATAPTAQHRSAAAVARMHPLLALLLMTRPSQLLLILVIFANGAMLAAWRGDGSAAALLVAAVLLVAAAAAVHLANEAADHETDRRTRRTRYSGGSGALEASGLDPRVPLALALALAAFVLGASVAATAWAALPIVAALILALGLAGGLAYSLPPVAAMRRGWGEVLNALLGAMLLPLFGVAAFAAAVSPHDVVAFVPFTCVTFASVLATAWPDRRADAATGKRTLQVRLERRTLRALALGAAAAFVVSTVLSIAVGAMPLASAGLLIMPLLVVGLTRYTRVEDPSASVAAMVGLGLITFVVLAATTLGGVTL